MNPIPTLGRIVLYTLTEQDALEINRRRTSSAGIREQISNGTWSMGAQAHMGNPVFAGEVFPGMVVQVYGDDMINVQVFLDGNDTLWATSKSVSDEGEPGKFHWMPYQKAQVEKSA